MLKWTFSNNKNDLYSSLSGPHSTVSQRQSLLVLKTHRCWYLSFQSLCAEKPVRFGGSPKSPILFLHLIACVCMFVCVCVHVWWMCTYVCMGECTCMPMFRGGLQMPSFTALHLPSEAVSLLSLELVGLTELTEQQTPQDLSVSASLTSGLYVFFMWMLKIQLRSSCLHKKHFTKWVISPTRLPTFNSSSIEKQGSFSS